MENKRRTFVAIRIEIEPELKQWIFNFQQALSEDRIKWVNMGNMHLTLFFLGDTPESLIPDVITVLNESVKKIRPIRLTLSGAGIFRNFHDPKVIWIGIGENLVLMELHRTIQDGLVRLGFSRDKRDFKPHLTIGRPKWIRNKDRLKEQIGHSKNKLWQEAEIDEVIYYESILKSGGPVYRVIEKFKLSV